MSASIWAVPNVQTFFIPFPEADFQTSLKAIDVTGTPVGNQMKTIISLVVPTAGTVVRYDQWEDGYEADLNAPVQSTTLIWGDGNTSNGTAPGYPTDIFPAGATVNLTNNVALPRAAGTLFYDGRDRIGCTAAIAVTRAGWGVAPGTVLASATEVYDTRRYGTSYKIPIGITTGSVQNFEYSSLHIIAGSDNTTVQVDVDGNGTVDQTKVINLGESMLVNGGVKAGATVTSDKPVQVHELTGDVGSTYESRTFAIRPTSLWGSSYFSPVGTTLSTEVHTVFLYNPGASAITVTYETTTSTGTISVPANGNSQFAMPMNSGGHFFTVSGEVFYAVGANDSGAAATSNQTHDWGYALVPESYLTTGIVIGFGPGSDDLSAPTGPDQNGSPVWITPATSTTIYVNYSGDFTIGAFTAPNGSKYDVSYNVNKLQSQTIYDPNDKDMTKARIFTTDGSKLAAAWGEDPSKAGPGAPYLDMGTTIVPFPQPALSKTSALVVDLNSDGKTGFGDTIEYTVRVANEGVVDLDNTIVLDALPNTCTYVGGSTKVNGITITDNTSPATIFPVDESGYTLVSIPPGGFTLVKYRVTVNNGATSVINHASANGGQAVLTATTTMPIVPAGGSAPTTITFSDSVGTSTTSYPQNGNVYVTVTNVDLNTDSAAVETIVVTVTDTITGDQELITLTETGPATGVFRNTSALPSSISGGLTQQDGTLYARQGDTLVTTFLNTLFGGTFTANAVIQTSTQTKKLYLTDTLALDRVNPAAAPVDATTASTAVLSTSGGSSTIAVSSAAATSNSAQTATTHTFSYNSGVAASNRILIVGVSYRNNNSQTISSVTYGGQAMTLVGSNTVAVSTPDGATYIYRLVNPPTGANNVVVNWSAALVQGSVVGAITYSGVDQTTPTGTFASANSGTGTSTAPAVTVTSAVGRVVFGLAGGRTTTAYTLAGSGGTSLWSVMPFSNQTAGAAQSKAGAATNTTLSWTGTNDEWTAVGVSLIPASGAGNPTTSFTQTPTFATAFTMPAGALPTAGVYYTVSSGTMPASPIVTAVLKKGATTIATSSSASASGGLLSFTFPALASAANFAVGDAATLDITTAQSGVTFTVDYDSSTKPSVINLPTTTVIAINSFGLYDAAYPGGSPVTTMTNGQRVYARAVASDPFGGYDITSLDLTITDPSAGTSTVNLTTTMASTASTKTFEYSWLAGPADGGYTVQAKANEGSEGINATSTVPLQVMSLDLGTPSTTTFTDSSGNTVPSYTTTGPVYVQVVDRDQNTNIAVVETVTVVVTTSNGDRMTVTLTETGANTGIFRSAAITTSVTTVVQNDTTLNVVAGATLAANYVDPTDPADTSSASAYIAAPPATAVASVFKSLISPTSGKALVGGTVSYNITVTNPGSLTLATVGLSDTFPAANLQFASASIAPTTTGSGTLSWTNVGPLTAGQSVSITVNFTALAAGATVTNSASVSGTATAGPSSVNVAIEKPGVTVTKTLLTPASGPVYIGDTIVWRIVVLNSGSTSLTTVPLSDNFSGGALTYVSSTTAAPDSVGTGSLLWNNIGPISATTSKTFDVTMTVKGTSNPTTNTADVSYAVDASGNSVSPSVSSASVQTIGGSIGTTIFKDMNNNGVFDSGEGVQNVYVYSDTNGNGTREVGEPFGITDYYGAYSIYNLPVAVGGTTYNIKVDTTTLPAGLTTVVVDPDATKNGQTSITLTRAALNNTTANFGYRGTASVSDTVWLDVNGDGVLDATERRISGVKVFVDQNNNGTVDANEPFAVTDSNGNYLISNLPDYTWTVAVDTTTLPAGVSPTYDLNGIATANKTSVILTPGQARTDVDFGYVGGASIGTTIYNDLNGDGVKATTDPGLAGVKVFIDLNADGIRQANEQFATADASGTYLISGLTAGTYTVVVDTTTLPAGVTVKGDPDATKDGKTTVTLTSAQALITANFGYQGNASVGDRVWNDLNGDGVQGTTEPAISGVKLFIDLNANGSRDSNEPFATTDASGNYAITGLAAGSYTVAVDTTTLPAGVTQTGDPDATVNNKTSVTLASGQTITTADFGYQGNASVGDYIWNDANGDGVQDTTEQPIAGVKVFVDLNANGIRDANEPFATTNASGVYNITGLTPGTYTVAVDTTTLPSGTSNTGDPDATKDGKTTVTLAAGVPNTTTDFGYQGTAAISAVVFLDRNASGVQNPGEPGIPSVTVFLDLNGDGTRQSNEQQATTNAIGAYGFSGLTPGNYSVVVVSATLPTGVTQTADADVTKDNKTTVTLTAGTTNTTPNFGYQGNASVGDYVWIDANGNGAQDATEIPLAGVVVYMDLNGNGTRDSSEPFATTNASGVYTINGLTPGTATVAVDASTLPAGSTNTGDPDATKDGRTSVTLVSGQSLTTADFGYQGSGSIGTTIWNDLNGDGIQNATDLPLAGVKVFIDLNNDGIRQVTDPVATTNASGIYALTGLPAGTYHIAVDGSTLPAGVTSTGDPDATKDGKTDVVLTAGQNNTTTNFGYQGNASLGTTIWLDQNGDGAKGGTEPALAGVKVFIDRNGNGTRDANEPFATTNASGIYTISGLAPGTYQVVVDSTTLPTGVNNTGDPDATKDGKTSVPLVAAQNLTTANFGYQGNAPVTGHLYIDTNGSGTQDGVEPNLANVDVLITDSLGNTLTVATDSSGNWSANVIPGSTTANVQESDPQYPTGYNQTEGNDPTTFTAIASTSTNGGTDGYYLPATVTGHLYVDTNGNGTQDSGEPDLAGVDLLITASTGGTQTVTTNASGNWTASVPPGATTANVQESDPQYPTGYTQTEGNDPTTFTAVAGVSANGGTDGYFLPSSISGFVLVDTNNDNTGDAPLSGVILTLVDSSGAPILNAGNPVTATTALNGSYSFGNLPPGTYGVVEAQPSGYNSVSDKDGGNPNEIRPIAVLAGVPNTGNNFIEEQPGSISGAVFKDTDGDGDADAPLANVTLHLLDGLGQPVLDGSNQPLVALSAANGSYSFGNLPPGNYCVVQDQPTNYNSVSDTDGANNNVIGNETPITVSAGNNNGGNNFIEIELGVISGYVLLDTDNNGSGDAPLPGVVVNLLNGSGNLVLDGNGAPIQVASGAGGFYSFTLVPVGTYRVSQNQPSGYGSVSDVDGANNNVIGDETPILMTPGLVVVDKNFVEIRLGSISGYVYVDASPLAGVTLTLLDGSGNPVDGDPNLPGVQLVTTVTDSTGFYRFTGLMPGTYQVAQTQPFGYNSFGDADGGNLDIIGDVTVITVLPGLENGDNDFIETPDTCPDTWAEWKFQHPGEQAGGNPDADAYDNLNEFSFAMPPGSGAGNAWTIQPSLLNVGTIEGVFLRPKGAIQNVTYTLQYAAVPGNPTVWQSILITPALITTADNGDCTETVTIHGLETLTGLIGGNGVVRIKAELDEENDSVIDHTSCTEVEGWKVTGFELCCRTYSSPFLRETEFTGTISGVNGQTLDLSVSAGTQDLSSLLFGGAYYVEVASGENEGQRFDVVSATADSLTLATDSNLFENAAPYNTLSGALPATLAGDTIVLRRHWTLGELFPADGFGATDDPATADQVQLFTDGQWTIYWLYDDGVSAHRWVKTGDNTYADQASAVIPPGQGLFFNNRTSVSSILAYGEVRNNDFVRPLAVGSNLVGSGYPLDQSAAGRAMNIAGGFFGSRDIATADTFYLWRADSTVGATGYDSYFLNNNAPRVPTVIKWAKIGDATLLSRDAEILLQGNRSVFIRSKNGINGYMTPKPWTP
ncbi:MAG: SdrD B-like domain-containing protein [Luteolibacter sp.]|uniref:SdrD B-like domain-containing protein n=1 Tax=Luteolibacter sp. TaxID=1962973 RepID=UPI00326777FE